jgi:hypothetical protein
MATAVRVTEMGMAGGLEPAVVDAPGIGEDRGAE